MSSLRDALEKLLARYDELNEDWHHHAAQELREALAHPVEPECLGDNVCTNPKCPRHGVEPAGVSDEARAAGLKALLVDNGWHKSDGTGVWRANYKRAVDLVLEAAQPFMQPQVVASRCTNCDADTLACTACGARVEPWG